MQGAYGVVGVTGSRTTYTRIHDGRAGSADALQPGDLVFTEGSASGQQHVSMFIGDGLVVHPPHHEARQAPGRGRILHGYFLSRAPSLTTAQRRRVRNDPLVHPVRRAHHQREHVGILDPPQADVRGRQFGKLLGRPAPGRACGLDPTCLRRQAGGMRHPSAAPNLGCLRAQRRGALSTEPTVACITSISCHGPARSLHPLVVNSEWRKAKR
ncbi:NlpC/P60 family protein [Streptomyces coeruleoprunus]|uniref:NlpC/P60 family protein n=1 Tax=Streptomyces coeruleoprunus TaxID=285563 RepID=A0ABV9XHC9_9ACTN